MKERHILLSCNSHGVYTCKCGRKWRDGEESRCPLSAPREER